MATPNLLHFRLSHYNEKVRWALDFKGLAHTREAVMPGFHMPRVLRASGQRGLPVLEFGDRTVVGSAQIIQALEEGLPTPPLYPADAQARAQALQIQAHFDDVVAPLQRRLFWSAYLDDPDKTAALVSDGFSPRARARFRRLAPVMMFAFRKQMQVNGAAVEAAEAALVGHFDWVQGHLGPTGYLVGEGFSVADLAAASVLSAILRPAGYTYPLPEPQPARLLALRERIADHPGAAWVGRMFAQHRGGSAEVGGRGSGAGFIEGTAPGQPKTAG